MTIAKSACHVHAGVNFAVAMATVTLMKTRGPRKLGPQAFRAEIFRYNLFMTKDKNANAI